MCIKYLLIYCPIYQLYKSILISCRIDRPGVSKHIYTSDVFQSFVWTFSKDAQM